MRLTDFSVRGFRSLADVSSIPVGGPTILAGHNDGGKSAVLAAMSYLVGAYELVEEDRTYTATEEVASGIGRLRCATTEVDGNFKLDPWEQSSYHLPEELRIRRYADEALQSRWQMWASVPDDERLRDLSALKVPDLRALMRDLGIRTTATRRADFEALLREYASGHSTSQGWLPLPAELTKRMPTILAFDGKAVNADDAVKAALTSRFRLYVDDTEIQGRLQALERQIQDQIKNDAKSLCDHIQNRCPDLKEVSVEPEVSFTHGFRGAPLRIARTSGELVSLERSGLGSSRRISLAIWEWVSELLGSEETDQSSPDDGDSAVDGRRKEEPVQVIVVYDEPDTHLDYIHQRKVMKLIREQSALTHVNVMVATHSMNLIDGVDITDVVHLKLENGRTVVERLLDDSHDSIDNHLVRISTSLGLRNSVLLHERCFLAVEGETEQQAFPLLFRLAEGMTLQSAGIALWGCGNNGGALLLAKYLVTHGRTVMLIVDADSINAPKGIFKLKNLQEIFGVEMDKTVKMLGKASGLKEFEELFSDQLWARAANDLWPREGATWTEADFAVLRTEGKYSERVLAMVKEGSPIGPGGKPAMMSQLASSLTNPADVPTERRVAALLAYRAVRADLSAE